MRKVFNASLLSRTFGIDVRSLALFRVGLALAFLYDWTIRISDLSKYYTDDGVLPRAVALTAANPTLWAINLHMLSGLKAVEMVLFGIAGLSALAMLVGYRTRLATFITWLLLISVQNRNTMILHGGDVVIRMLFFWAMFVPLGARYSFDSIRHQAQRRLADANALKGGARPPGARSRQQTKSSEDAATEPLESAPRAFSIGTAGLLLQMCFIYWFSAILKSDPMWHDGTAVYYSLQFDQLARPLGLYLLQWPNVLRELTFTTYSLERLGPLLALCPFWHGRIRTAMVFCFIAFHISLGLCLSLGIFPIGCSVGWLAFLPSEAWDTLGSWLKAKPRPALNRPIEKIAALARRAGRALPGPEDRTGTGTGAGTLQRVRHLGGQGAAAFFLWYVLMWNLRTTDYKRYVAVFPRGVNWIADAARLDQMWSMFAPPPTKTDGWFVIPAILGNGLEVDLFNNGEPVTWDKPKYVVYTNKNEREQKYMITLATDSNPTERRYYAEYLRREWNRRHVETMHIATMQIYFMNEPTLPDHNPAKPVKQLLGNYAFQE